MGVTVLLPPARELLEATGEARNASFFGTSEGARPCRPLDFRLGLQKSENTYFCCLKKYYFVAFCYSGPNNLYPIHRPILLALYIYEITCKYFSSNSTINMLRFRFKYNFPISIHLTHFLFRKKVQLAASIHLILHQQAL